MMMRLPDDDIVRAGLLDELVDAWADRISASGQTGAVIARILETPEGQLPWDRLDEFKPRAARRGLWADTITTSDGRCYVVLIRKPELTPEEEEALLSGPLPGPEGIEW